MPAREFLNPYASLTTPDPALGGIANLAAGLAAAPGIEREQMQKQQEIGQRDLFQKQQLDQGQQRLDQEGKRTDIEAAGRDARELERQAEADRSQTERETHHRATEGQHALDSAGRGAKEFLGLIHKGFQSLFGGKAKGHPLDAAMRSSQALEHATATARNEMGHDAPADQIQARAGQLYDTWQADPGSHLIPRPKQAAGPRVFQPPAVTAPAAEPPTDYLSWLRPSGRPGVHTLGDVTGGRWFGNGDMPAGEPAAGGPNGAPPAAAASPAGGASSQVMPKAVLMQKAQKAGMTPADAQAYYEQRGFTIGD